MQFTIHHFILIFVFFLYFYITLPAVMPGGGGGYSPTLSIRVCATQRGCDFEDPDLERGTHFSGVF